MLGTEPEAVFSPGCGFSLRFSCWKDPTILLDGRGFDSEGGGTGRAPGFSEGGRLVVVVVGIEGGSGGGGFDISWALCFASSAAA